MSKTCGHAGVMEFNGDVYSCDHFVYPEHCLGNLNAKTMTEMMYSEQQQAFSKMKLQRLPRQCKECDFLFACHGECPKNRFLTDCYGNYGLNYLCKGYHRFFEHVAPYMDFMIPFTYRKQFFFFSFILSYYCSGNAPLLAFSEYSAV